MKLSKKQQARLTQLINALQVYDTMTKNELQQPDRDNDKVLQSMGWSNEQQQALNKEFGTTLIGYNLPV